MTKVQAGILVPAILAIALVAYESPVLRFHGTGRIWGGPGFGYQITMRPIPFSRPGKYVFNFRGVPAGDMSLQLRAEGKSDQNRAQLVNIKTKIEAVLVDQNGGLICQGSGRPGEGQNEHIWVLTSAYWGSAFWHWKCAHIPLKPSVSYTLTINISDVDPKAPDIALVPVLESDHKIWP